MDNLTHTLIGLAAGELATQLTRRKESGLPALSRRTALLGIGMIGGNLPDIDLLWSYSTTPGDNLAYILEHRGYTHTLLGCAALALLLYVAAVLLLRWRKHRPGLPEHLLLAGFAMLSVLLHLAMDALNSYGVHPFWPFNNKWYYGDAVFIVEPLYWLAAAPLLFSIRTWSARWVLALVLLIGNVAILLVHRFEPVWFAVPLVTALLLWAGWQLAERNAAITTVGVMIALTLGFLGFSTVASARLQQLVQQQYPGYHTLEQVMTPSPAQPLCWDVVVLQRREDELAARSGQVSLTGSFDAVVCPQLTMNRANAAGLPEAGDTATTLRWDDQDSMSIARFNEWVAADCQARAALQFIRAPMLTTRGDATVLSDLRFSRGGAGGLGSVLLAPRADSECKHHVPWLPPRVDVITDSGR